MYWTATLAGNTTTMRAIILPALLVFGLHVQGQDKGFVSGTFNVYSENVEEDGTDEDLTYTNITFGPAVGINLGEKNVLGLAFNIENETEQMLFYGFNTGVYIAEQRTTLIEVAPFYRRVKSIGDKCSMYGQFTLGIGTGKQTMELDNANAEQEVDISTLRVTMGPGIFYNLADHWAVSADWGLLGYASRKETFGDGDDKQVTTTTGIQILLNPGALTFALNYCF